MLTFSPFDAESLIAQYRQELTGFLFRRVSCQETTNDLLQDLFLRLISVKSTEPIHNPRAFLCRIAANLATDHLRRQRTDPLVCVDDHEALAMATVSLSPEQQLPTLQELALCEQTLRQLSPLGMKIFIRHSGFVGLDNMYAPRLPGCAHLLQYANPQ